MSTSIAALIAALCRRPAMVLFGCVALLFALRAIEAQWPPLALWAFVLLSLTLGFGHGALDAVLMLGQFVPRSKALAVSVAYLLCVLLAGQLLSRSVPVALLLLVIMSAWHFGEMHSYAVWARLCVGGASVMWPMLVAPDAIGALLLGTLGSGFGTAWRAWQMLAYGWFVLLLVCAVGWTADWFLHRNKRTGASQGVQAGNASRVPYAALEMAALLCAYLVLSPLLAFALYFGLYHSLVHMARVRRALLAHRSAVAQRYTVVFVASALGTAALLALLWWFLPEVPGLGGGSPALANLQANSGQVLQWLVVSLAAVTLPHLMLVSYSARWLGR